MFQPTKTATSHVSTNKKKIASGGINRLAKRLVTELESKTRLVDSTPGGPAF